MRVLFVNGFTALVALCLLSVSGCGVINKGFASAPKRYVDVVDEKKAKLRVKYGKYDYFRIYPNSSKCIAWDDSGAGIARSKPVLKGGLGFMSGNGFGFEDKTLGMPYPPFPQSYNASYFYSEFYIPAEKEFLVEMSYSSSSGNIMYSCPVRYFSMNAIDGSNYELELFVEKNICQYSMKEIVADGKRIDASNWKPASGASCD